MPDAEQLITLTVNGKPVSVAAGTTIAAAILMAGIHTRTSVCGEPRAPLCGMGICFECSASVGGDPHQRTCQILCSQGMDVCTR